MSRVSEKGAEKGNRNKEPGMIYDVAVIGGGASGMAAAIAAGQRGTKTALAEAQPRVGRKLLSTGNGRCNISNRYITAEHYRSDCMERVKTVLSREENGGIERFFLDIGVPVAEEREGRLYPRGETAAGVLDMLRFELERLGVDVMTDSRTEEISLSDGVWTVNLNGGRKILSRTVIIACGSPANPQLGGCGDGDRLVSSLGIRVIKRQPALCPLLSDSPVLSTLKGVRVHCRVTLYIGGKAIRSEDGELQFNEGSLSGVCVFQLSSRVRPDDYGAAALCADLLPDMPYGEVLSMLMRRRDRLREVTAENFLSGLLNKRAACAVLKLAEIRAFTEKAGVLGDSEINRIAQTIKAMDFNVTGHAGMKQAQTASGGIPLTELDDDLAVKGFKGLFACGEAVNCSGDCGGFNLHWAWCSGITAGNAAADTADRYYDNK